MQNDSQVIRRVILKDSIRALMLAHVKTGPLLKETEYAAGYQEGYETALLAMAELIGVASDIHIQVILPAQIEKISR